MNIKEIMKEFSYNADRFLGKGKRVYAYSSLIWNALLYGFHPHDYFLYDVYKLSRYEKRKFITSRKWKRLEKLNNSVDKKYLDDKRLFDEKFSQFIHRDYLFMQECTKEQYSDFVSKHKTAISKAIGKCGGKDIEKIDLSTQDSIEKYYSEYVGKDFLLEEEIVQHEKMSSIHPQSVNGIRISTLIHKGEVHILAASLKAGIGDTITDNSSGGGMIAALDLDTGIVISEGMEENSNRYMIHPDSGVVLLGFQVPNWDMAKGLVIDAAKLIPDVKYVGWDVAILHDGVCLIEGNTGQGEDNLQVGQDGKYLLIKSIVKS